MTHLIIFRPEVEQELAEAVDWYEDRGQGLGAEFLRSVDAVIAHIQRHPTLYPVVFGTARRAADCCVHAWQTQSNPLAKTHLTSPEVSLHATCLWF